MQRDPQPTGRLRLWQDRTGRRFWWEGEAQWYETEADAVERRGARYSGGQGHGGAASGRGRSRERTSRTHRFAQTLGSVFSRSSSRESGTDPEGSQIQQAPRHGGEHRSLRDRLSFRTLRRSSASRSPEGRQHGGVFGHLNRSSWSVTAGPSSAASVPPVPPMPAQHLPPPPPQDHPVRRALHAVEHPTSFFSYDDPTVPSPSHVRRNSGTYELVPYDHLPPEKTLDFDDDAIGKRHRNGNFEYLSANDHWALAAELGHHRYIEVDQWRFVPFNSLPRERQDEPDFQNGALLYDERRLIALRQRPDIEAGLDSRNRGPESHKEEIERRNSRRRHGHKSRLERNKEYGT